MRIAVAGVSHDHIYQMIGILDRGDIEVVGVSEENDRYREECPLHQRLAENCFFKDVREMLETVHPEAVVCYGPPCDHLAIVRECALHGVDVMMEKPMTTSYKDALKIRDLAQKYGINVLTNYCTTWYAAKRHAKEIADSGKIGRVFKMNFYGGHRGPAEIGCSEKFVSFLKDPKKGGAGAIVDFGCYGANLATWMMGGVRPESVYAVMHTNKPQTYAPVDDDSTIVLKYANGVVVTIYGSWDWPYTRLDSYIYGSEGSIYQKDDSKMQVLVDESLPTEFFDAPGLKKPLDDPYRFLKAVVRGELKVSPTDLPSLENNMTTMEILDAAIRSARLGKKITL